MNVEHGAVEHRVWPLRVSVLSPLAQLVLKDRVYRESDCSAEASRGRGVTGSRGRGPA